MPVGNEEADEKALAAAYAYRKLMNMHCEYSTYRRHTIIRVVTFQSENLICFYI